MPTRICFICHGETDWNAGNRIQGQIDVSLNETGRMQALAMAFNAAHHNFSAIYSSDLNRAYETANVLAEREGLIVKTLSQLRERHYGMLQGICKDELDQYPDAYAYYLARDLEFNFNSGKSLQALANRVADVINSIVNKH